MLSTKGLWVIGFGAALFAAGCGCGGSDGDGGTTDADGDTDTDSDTGPVCATNADCDDGVFCNGRETCLDGAACVPGRSPSCDDGLDCTADSCDSGADACANAPDDARCDDGRTCNGAETCDTSRGCTAIDLPECDDGVPCTWDTCDDTTGGCVNVALSDRCDDRVFCNGDETCDVKQDCVAGPLPLCEDGVPCTVDSCDIGSDACVSAPDDERCDDGRICNGEETCDAVDGCSAADLPDCDDSIDCTWDTCDDATGDCIHVAIEARCSDDDVCNGVEACNAERGCVQIALPLDCSDPWDCTLDRCDPLDGCSNDPDDSLCSDGAFCNGAEVCSPDPYGWGEYFCTGGPRPDCDDVDICTNDSCDPDADGGAGACAYGVPAEICASGVDEDCDGETDEVDCIDPGCLNGGAVPPVSCDSGSDPFTGDPWVVCEADCGTAWLSADNAGTYAIELICQNLGYTGASQWGGTCGNVCGYCEEPTACDSLGTRIFDGSTGCDPPDSHCTTVMWECSI